MVACKYRRFKALNTAVLVFLMVGCLIQKADAQIVTLITEKGNIKLRLYDDTPLHKANFLKNVKEGKYNGVLFHRVIRDFMVQSGDPGSLKAKPGQLLGADVGRETVPAEILPAHYHKRGALAAARQPDETNPLRKSSQYQFFIVDGRDYTAGMLRVLESNYNRPRRFRVADSLLTAVGDSLSRKQLDSLMGAKDYRNADKILGVMGAQVDSIIGSANLLKFTDQQIIDYTSLGGVPNLDGKYTVFGEVIEGIEIIDLISSVETDQNNRPKTDIRILEARIE